MPSSPPVTVRTLSCTPFTTLLTPAFTPVSCLKSATFLPALPIITPASFEDTIARIVNVDWAYSSSDLGCGSPSGPTRFSSPPSVWIEARFNESVMVSTSALNPIAEAMTCNSCQSKELGDPSGAVSEAGPLRPQWFELWTLSSWEQSEPHSPRVLDRVARKCDSLMTQTKAGGAQGPTGSCRDADRIVKALRYRRGEHKVPKCETCCGRWGEMGREERGWDEWTRWTKCRCFDIIFFVTELGVLVLFGSADFSEFHATGI